MQQQHASPHRKLRRNHIALKKMWDVNWQVKQHSDNFLPAKRCTYHRANVMQSMQSSILHVFILLHMGLFSKNMEIISQMSLSKWLEEAAHTGLTTVWYTDISWCRVRLCDVQLSFWVRQPKCSWEQWASVPFRIPEQAKTCLRDDPCATTGRSLVFGLPGILSHLKYWWWFLSCALVERIAPLTITNKQKSFAVRISKVLPDDSWTSIKYWRIFVMARNPSRVEHQSAGGSLRASPKYSHTSTSNIG